MPYNRPGPGVYVTNGATALTHGQACNHSSGFVGVAVKQKARPWSDGVATQATIDANEPFFLITKGIVQVSNADAGIAGAAKGTPVYINATNVLVLATGSPKFGRIVEIGGQRGVPANRVRIDLDSKDSFV
jgi:hypothetical protein